MKRKNSRVFCTQESSGISTCSFGRIRVGQYLRKCSITEFWQSELLQSAGDKDEMPYSYRLKNLKRDYKLKIQEEEK